MRKIAQALFPSLLFMSISLPAFSVRAEEAPAVALAAEDARSLFQVLENTGVENTSELLGSIDLRAEQILCATYVLPQGVPDCSLNAQHVIYKVSGPDSLVLFALLLKYKAFTPGPQGVNKLWIHQIECTKVVVPEATANCTFLVGPDAPVATN